MNEITKAVKSLVTIPENHKSEMRLFNLNIKISTCGTSLRFVFPQTKRYHTQFVAVLLVSAFNQLPGYDIYTAKKNNHILRITLVPSGLELDSINW